MQDYITMESDRLLECKLTDDEVQRYGKEHAELLQRADELEAERGRVNKDFKARIDGIMSDVRRRGCAIVTGKEERKIKVEFRFDWRRQLVTARRLDTFEEVPHLQRSMTAAEVEQYRQMPLRGVGEVPVAVDMPRPAVAVPEEVQRELEQAAEDEAPAPRWWEDDAMLLITREVAQTAAASLDDGDDMAAVLQEFAGGTVKETVMAAKRMGISPMDRVVKALTEELKRRAAARRGKGA